MQCPALPADRPPSSRLRWWAAVVAIVGFMGLGAFFGWPGFREWAELRKPLQLAEDDQFEEARPLLLRFLERYPNNVAATRALALGYLHQSRQLVETKHWLDRWCELQPEDPEAFRNRLDFFTMQQMVIPAIADAQHILEFHPDDRRLRVGLTRMLLTAGRYEEAEKEGLRCFREDPENRELWYFLANIYYGLGQGSPGNSAKTKAAALLDQLLSEDPDHLAGLKLRAKLFVEAGQPDMAVRLLEERVVGNPKWGETEGLAELSDALLRAGRAAESKRTQAELQWRQALILWSRFKQRDESLGLQERVVQGMLADDKADRAVAFLSGILERNHRAPPGTHELLALCYDKLGQVDRAREQRDLAGLKKEEAKNGKQPEKEPK